MNEPAAVRCVEMMLAAWPWFDASDDAVELWVSQLATLDVDHVIHAISTAVATLERPPTIAWVRGTARAEQERTSSPTRALGPGTANEANVRRFTAAARVALSGSKVHRHGDPAGPCPTCGGWRPDLALTAHHAATQGGD